MRSIEALFAYFALRARLENLCHERNDVQKFLRAHVIRFDRQRFDIQVLGKGGGGRTCADRS